MKEKQKLSVALQRSSKAKNTFRLSGSREIIDITTIKSAKTKPKVTDQSKTDSKVDYKLDTVLPSLTSGGQRTPTLAVPSEGPNDSVVAPGSVKSRKYSSVLPFGGTGTIVSRNKNTLADMSMTQGSNSTT